MQSVLENLPVGWRFHPTDEELLLYYLKNKRLGLPIYGFDVEDIQICDFDPWDLIDKNSRSKERYLFYRRQFHQETRGIQRKRKAKTGFWKRTGKIQSITRDDGDESIATKKIFVYHHNHDPKKPTEFVKHEFELKEELDFPIKDDNDYVLCKLMINNKKKGIKKQKKVNFKKEAAIRSKKIEVNPKKKKARNSYTAPNSLSDGQKEDNLAANSAEGEPSNHTTSDLNYQKRYKISNVSIYDKDSTSFLMDSDPIQNSKEISIPSRYSMSEASSRRTPNLESQYSNDLTTISSHERSSTLFKNQYSNETVPVSTHNNVATSPSGSNQTDTTFYSNYSNRNDNHLYSAYTNQDERSYPVTFDSENQNPGKETNVADSLEARGSLLQEEPPDSGKENQYDNTFGKENQHENVFGKENQCENIESLDFPEINSQMLDELIGLDDLQDTLCSEPTQPINPSN